MKLSELLSLPLLEEMIAEGYVTRRWHRDYDLAILNYTDKAQFGNEWNPVTRQCRGLIVRYDDDFQDAEVIARPFPKFFNYGQPGAELVYLASVHIHLGEVDRFSGTGVPTPYAPLLAGSLREALALEPRENAEGVVVMTDDGRAVKLKQEDYLLKHKARFSLTPMRVWEAWSAGVTLDQFIEGLPDEFHDAVMEAWGSIETGALALEFTALAYHAAVPDAPRREQAAYIFEHFPEMAPAIFALLDGNEEKLESTIRKAVKPTGPAATTLIA